MKIGDIIYIDYVARVKETNEIIDLTNEEIAKKENIYDEKRIYKPLPTILGFGFLIRGLEEELLKMEVNEEKIIEIPPEKAFGKRDESLVKTFNLSELKKLYNSDIELKVGEYINFSGILGKILSINGGRITIDFNHPLAGKTLVYNVKILKKVEDDMEKTKAILEIFIRNIESFEIKEDKENDAIIVIDKENTLTPEQKKILFNNISKIITNKKRLIFINVFEIKK